MGAPPSADFLAAFRAAAPAGTMRFDRFVELALYHPELGYYRRAAKRVGRSVDADFATASSIGPPFGRLVAAAAAGLVAGRGGAAAHDFVELGAEGAGVLGEGHPFRAGSVRRLGDALAPAGRCAVFSNELFDAQPFRRVAWRGGSWRELGVALRGGAPEEADLGPADLSLPCLRPLAADGRARPEGYTIDLPTGSLALLREIIRPGWSGLFLAFDYGKSWRELSEETPAGTARAYHRHRQSNGLLDQPGGQDLTCHVCWDWLSDGLREAGFEAPVLDSQEAFFIRHAAPLLETLMSGRDPKTQSALRELLHPGNFGQKFQVLYAYRP